jgi:hypothetical protein
MICKHITPVLQKNVLLLLVCFLCCRQALAQQAPKKPVENKKTTAGKPPVVNDHDTSYYQSFARNITARFYFSKKYTGFELGRDAGVPRFRYLPHTSLVMGIGLTYQSISLNLGYGFGFLNPNHDKGKTKYLDLQSHVYARKWTIDLFGQFYKGYYLTPKGHAASNPETYYIRPDLRVELLGVSAYRLLNPATFSYRAALLQNEKQKKSSGSFLVGAEIYRGSIKADSSMVPNAIAAGNPQSGARKVEFFRIGPGAGYAYTVVMDKSFFLTGSLCASISLDHTKQYDADSSSEKFALTTGFIYRVVAGYSHDYWNINASLVGNELTVAAAGSPGKYRMAAGNIRLTFAKIIKPGRELKRKLHPIDNIIDATKSNP